MDLIYAHPSDNIAPFGTISGSTLASGSYGQLVDLDPATAPLYLGATPNSWAFVFNFTALGTSFLPVKWVVLVGTNWWQTLGTTRSVVFDASASDSWPGVLGVTAPVMPAYSTEGIPVGIAIDLTAYSAIYTTAHKWARLIFQDTQAAGGPAPVVGEILMYTARRTIRNLANGLQMTPRWPAIMHQTPAHRDLAYSEDVRQWMVDGSQRYSDVQWAQLEALAANARGVAKPFAIQLATTEEPLLVRLTAEPTREKVEHGINNVKLGFAEVVNDRVA